MSRLSKIGAACLAAFGWTTGGVSAVTATYLVVAGGGGGGNYGGGGGAGGYLTGTLALNPSLSYTVTIGAGGSGASVRTTRGSNGSDSVFSTVTSTGGGGGGSDNTSPYSGASGGSGGGGSYNSSGAGGSGTVGQGNAGGSGINSAPNYTSGGGGGAGAVGGNGSAGGAGGSGGNGLASSISGTSTYYAGGGGGDSQVNGSVAPGGSGGGGAGARTGVAPVAGTANLGGGGGGGGSSGASGAQGGSGIVIISYAGAQQFSGGVVTSVGGNTIHTFTTSGTLGPITTLSASYLIVAGGGGGGYDIGGGGGAGGLLSGSALTIDPNSTYLVTVGSGGAGATSSATGTNGSNSAFSMVSTAAVGGGGGGSRSSAKNGANGGSGGGGSADVSTGGTGTVGQGNNGGSQSSGDQAAGGGGASAAGAGGGGVGTGTGNGGDGSTSSISGTSTYYAGGGGGGSSPAQAPAGTGGAGGGGAGSSSSTAATAGTANTGGGGGGGSNQAAPGTNGANGGSGIVIISYPGSTQQMAGGTVTIVGGNVIHTFTSTGYLAPIKYANNSLRFRNSVDAYLSRTAGTQTSNTTWTFSAWVKRGQITAAANRYLFHAQNGGNTLSTEMFFATNDTLVFREYGPSAYSSYLQTTQVFRDPAAWYHIELSYDASNTTSGDRVRLYINGSRVSAFSTATYPSSGQATAWNTSGNAQEISYGYTVGFDGYMAEINFIDGQALTPNSFGTFNSYGVWQPITYGGSYGKNGFYLPFTSNTSSYVGSFNGSNQYLSIASNSVFNQSGDFTIEYYANLTSNTNYQVVVGRGTGFITIQHSSDANAMVRLVRYGQATLATGGNVTAGKWNHFAIVRSGSTVSGYVNGVLVASGTDSTSTATGNALAIGQNSDATNYFNGQISNVRYTNTAVYTSNFTPSTSALSAVTGTQLLTLQNSSIVDNSTNALSITNNNTVTTGQTYPFAYGIFNDQSPQGNNWTPNNISGVLGSTLDYMTDVPTLTSATAANYCVLNPLSNDSTNTLSAANLNYSIAANQSGYPTSTFQFNSGKWYWECTVTSTHNIVGIVLGTTGTTTTAFSTGYGYYYSGNKYVNGVSSAYGASYTTNDVIGVAVDLDSATKTIEFFKNGSSQGSITIAAGLYKTAGGNGNSAATATGVYNFGQRPFSYTPPTGFVALNTYNL